MQLSVQNYSAKCTSFSQGLKNHETFLQWDLTLTVKSYVKPFCECKQMGLV